MGVWLGVWAALLLCIPWQAGASQQCEVLDIHARLSAVSAGKEVDDRVAWQQPSALASLLLATLCASHTIFDRRSIVNREAIHQASCSC